MAMSGMDVEQVRGVARQLQQGSDQIKQLAAQLTSVLQGAQWVGQDQQRFLNDWNSQHRSALARVADGLAQASQAAARNADEQQQVSSR